MLCERAPVTAKPLDSSTYLNWEDEVEASDASVARQGRDKSWVLLLDEIWADALAVVEV